MNVQILPLQTKRDERFQQAVLLAGCGVFILSMSVFCILRHHNVWSDIFDMGVQTQVAWNTSQG